MGAISANEMASAIQRERQAALASTAAIKGRNAALAARASGPSSFNTANIAAQFQDIGVTAAMGMSPIQIALQQGTQLSAVLQEIKNSGQGVGKGLAAAFASVVSPLSLVTIGTIAAGTAAFQYFSTVMSEGDKSAELLKEQAALISAVAERWGDAVPALREYADQLKRAQDGADLQTATGNAIEQVLEEATKGYAGLKAAATAASLEMQTGNLEARQSFAVLIGDVNDLEGKIGSLSEAYRAGKDTSQEMADVTKTLARLLENDASTASDTLSGRIEHLSRMFAAATENASKLRQQALLAEASALTALHPSRGSYPGTFQSADNTIQGTQFPLPENGPMPGSRPSDLDTAKNRGFGSAKRTKTPQKTASDRFAEDLQAIRDRTEALRQEMNLIGLSNEERIKRRAALDLEQKALADLREEARKKGQTDLSNIQLSPDKIAAIEKEAAAYAKQAEELRKLSDQQQQTQNSASEFYDTARAGFVDVLKGTSSLSDALSNLANKFADLALNSAFDSLFGGKSASGSDGWLTAAFKAMGFSSGGYTGAGGKYEPAGIVHKGEYVMDAETVRKAGGPAAMEAMRRGLKGYSDGGYVGSMPSLAPPTLPKIADLSAANDNRLSIAPTYHIDARGADQAAVARIDASLQRMQRDLKATIISTVRNAPDKNIKLR